MMQTVRIIGSVPPVPAWTDRLAGEDWYHWNRLETLLRSNPKLKSHQVDSVASESLKVLRSLHDPRSPVPFQGRGLVVGYVQSGKTANYTAVAARAVDAGYRIVIVLSGIHDSLRSQTQNRLERELTGHQSGGVPAAKFGHAWVRLTTPERDFMEQDAGILQSSAPFLVVVKKNYRILMKLNDWLKSASRYLADMPVLIIDDEADQASINTKGNRPPDPAVSEEPEDTVDNDDSESSPSKINGLIRSILGRTTKAAYVAYTATPFANILINPEAVDSKVGDDLFPKDFVIQLPRPEGYTGTEELFGVSAQGRNVLRLVPDDDVPRLRSPRRRRGRQSTAEPEPSELPDSLSDALLSFCLAGAVRNLRPDLSGKSHTMLVHVSSLTDDQRRIASTVQQQVTLWRAAQRQKQDLRPLLRKVWNTFKDGVSLPAEEDEVIETAIAVLEQLVILELNSKTGENLEYEEKPGRHIVAIGGDRLSRGLTLEGLTVSYFLRTARMCDTLLQMARWYGFRHGYEDLIRIWTTDGIARWFAELALVEQSMRDSIIALERAGRRPDQMAIKLRKHSELLLTARNKSGALEVEQDSWSGDHPQTVLLPLADNKALIDNYSLTDAFLSDLPLPQQLYGGFLFRDVDTTMIREFLSRYRINPDTVAFRSAQLSKWIESRIHAGELTDWTVFVASTGQNDKVHLGGLEVGVVKRRKISSESIGILIDPRHEGVDLKSGPEAYKRGGGTYDTEAMRNARPPTQALLIIYPLDAKVLDVRDTNIVIALALSLPKTSDGTASWIVNNKVSNDWRA